MSGDDLVVYEGSEPFEMFTQAERGKRVERVEWGQRFVVDNVYGKRGEVRRCFRPDQAAGYDGAFYEGGPKRVEAVCRTVVTYTGDWEPA